jgi:hypothetical protein
MKYMINKSSFDTITVQLPLEINHPMEEIVWFLRRKGANVQSEWTNYSAVLSQDYDSVYNPKTPLLKSASIQLNGVEIINADEQYFRSHLAKKYTSGASYFKYVYGHSFSSKNTHQPTGTLNASKLQSVRLTLHVAALADTWEIKVFVKTLQWIRFQNGMGNPMFQN